jgi:hypothetical protein
MAKKFNIWGRAENKGISRNPLKRKTYPDEVGFVSDPSHPDPDIRERCIALDVPAKTLRYMQGFFDRVQGAFSSRSEEATHGSPMVQATRNATTTWKGLGSKMTSSKAVECAKCKTPVDRSQARLVRSSASKIGWDYVHKSISYGGCVEAEDKRRRGL